ncbi:MAG: hypothetical protein L3J24_04770 [Xanthomonadales bacterium]|nr:hypothetical protein [Xanthomonadales bacterium]
MKNQIHKSATFNEGLAIAFSTSLIGSVLYYLLSAFIGDSQLLRLLISIASFGYILYLLNRGQTRLGRVSIMGLWLVISTALWFYSPPAVLFLLVHISMLWIIRSLYFYSSALSALADLGLNLLSIAAAFWTARYTGSVFLSIWCFFLIQAMFVAIPKNLWSENRPQTVVDDHFQNAYRAAQSAVIKLSNRA